MNFGRFLEFDYPGAFDGNFDRCKRGFCGTSCRFSTLERIKLSSMTWALQLLGTFVIGNGAPLMGTNCRICEDTGLGAEENRWDSLLGCSEGVSSTDLELRGLDDIRCSGRRRVLCKERWDRSESNEQRAAQRGAAGDFLTDLHKLPDLDSNQEPVD